VLQEISVEEHELSASLQLKDGILTASVGLSIARTGKAAASKLDALRGGRRKRKDALKKSSTKRRVNGNRHSWKKKTMKGKGRVYQRKNQGFAEELKKKESQDRKIGKTQGSFKPRLKGRERLVGGGERTGGRPHKIQNHERSEKILLNPQKRRLSLHQLKKKKEWE